ncbi:hypothetical protein [uncultured Cocleimonas sp.]|uniref:hypothetical protein n=1 Tax=uncultured Cocleimonas sp. TaxID=1051587 RepID=UPI00260959C5|nr:hypothetical protein [uncultured Cocleimonas sp.]
MDITISFRGGCAIGPTSFYQLSNSTSHNDEDHIIITYYEKEQEPIATTLMFRVAGWHNVDGRLLLIGEDSELVFLKEGKLDKESKINFDCILTGTYENSKSYFAHGMSNCILSSDNGVDWGNFNKGIDKNIYGVMGLSVNNKGNGVCVGWDGEIYIFEDNKWIDLDSPTNSILTSCCILESGLFYACGKSGVIIKGKNNYLEVIEHSHKGMEFWDVFEYENEVFICASTTIFRLSDGELIPVVGWYLPEGGVYSSMMKTPTGFWIIAEKVTYDYRNGEFNEIPK